jgi:hypothetical protein
MINGSAIASDTHITVTVANTIPKILHLLVFLYRSIRLSQFIERIVLNIRYDVGRFSRNLMQLFCIDIKFSQGTMRMWLVISSNDNFIRKA